MEERLQKIIARAGIASRRHAEKMIASGLVTVNGQTVTQLGTKADPARDHIKVSGRLIHLGAQPIFLLLNKPPEVVSTMSDPEGRRSLRDLLLGVPERVFPVGRLEYRAMGAIILTNDGELANMVLQSHRIPQTWHIKLQKLLTFEEIEQLSRATGARIARLRGAEAAWYEVTVTELRRDLLRNRLFLTGHPVEKMKCVAIAGIELGRLGLGEHRELSAGEIASLRRAAAGESFAPPKISTPPPPSARPRPAFKPSAPRQFSRQDSRGARPAAGGGRPSRPSFKPRSDARPGDGARGPGSDRREWKPGPPGGGGKPAWKSRGPRGDKPEWKGGESRGQRKPGGKGPRKNFSGRGHKGTRPGEGREGKPPAGRRDFRKGRPRPGRTS